MATYSDLQDSILDYAKDPALDSAKARQFIADAEPMLERDFLGDEFGGAVPRQMLDTIQDVTDSTNKFTLPDDYITARAVRINGQRSRYASPELVNLEDQGFAEADVIIDYYKRIPVLSGTNTSNWLLDVGFDAYRWAALVQYAAWGQEMEAVEIWRGYYGNAMRTLKRSYRPQPRGNLYRHPNKYYQSFYTIVGGDMVFGRASQ